jgi:hypothetical protein
MHVFPGEGWGGGQRRCEGAEERDTMATTTTTTTLPLLQTERTPSACAVEPKKKQQLTFKVGGVNGEVTEGGTIR